MAIFRKCMYSINSRSHKIEYLFEIVLNMLSKQQRIQYFANEAYKYGRCERSWSHGAHRHHIWNWFVNLIAITYDNNKRIKPI